MSIAELAVCTSVQECAADWRPPLFVRVFGACNDWQNWRDVDVCEDLVGRHDGSKSETYKAPAVETS